MYLTLINRFQASGYRKTGAVVHVGDQAKFKQTTKQTLSKAGSKPQAKFSKNKNCNIVTMGEVISDGELESLW
jgi:hypothetical protein